MQVLKQTTYHWLLCCAAVCALFSFVHAASAQETQSLPGSADPSRFDERFRLDTGRNDTAPIITESLDGDTPIPQAQDGFILKGITLKDANAFPQSELNIIIAPYIGRTVDLTVLNHLADRITNHYRKEGYFLSKAIIPAQEVERGVVVVQVIEGYADQVTIDDPQSLLRKDRFHIVEKTVAQIQAMAPLHAPSLERLMLLLNDNGGIRASIVIDSDKADNNVVQNAGAVQIILRLDKRPDRTTVSANNHGSKFVGPYQVELSHVFLVRSYETI